MVGPRYPLFFPVGMDLVSSRYGNDLWQQIEIIVIRVLFAHLLCGAVNRRGLPDDCEAPESVNSSHSPHGKLAGRMTTWRGRFSWIKIMSNHLHVNGNES
ncbi:hypothetical protein RRG08_032907 [Elysia crispata]|uniref:Uncharacterized protein n=1 Tax=Elysia crispata TaxID=231223 RepID=A0AAE1A6X7_9GAST|nr:hypothetical protein RRG08_032907 [Elysia crispata]